MKLEDFKPGEVHTHTGFVAITAYGNLTHISTEMPEHGYVTILPYNITFTVPEGFNAVQEAVKSIDMEMDKERQELAEKLQRLQAKKNELLQISYEGNDILDAE